MADNLKNPDQYPIATSSTSAPVAEGPNWSKVLSIGALAGFAAYLVASVALKKGAR